MMHKIDKKAAILAVTVLLILICVSTIYCFRLLTGNAIYNGVFVENIPLESLTRGVALQKVKEYVNHINESGSISFSYEGEVYNYNINNLAFSYLSDKTVNDAYLLGREGGVANRLTEIRNLRKRNRNLQLEYEYDKEKLNKILMNLQKRLYIPEQGAKMFYKAGRYTVLKETVGKKLNIEKTIELFESSVNEKKFDKIPLVIEDVFPSSTSDDIDIIDSVIASASTNFSTQDVNRSFNIKYACQKLDGIVVMPGETFSMNNALGPRTPENGYKDAKVIFLDELVDGPGGGVCQVTTTLYMAVLKSLLNVTERMHHSLTLGYVPPGQDATIAGNYIDFKFMNNTDYPISINAETSGGNLAIRILSKKDKQLNVKLKSEVLEVLNPEPYEIIIDKSLPIGESIVTKEAKQGKHVQVIREIYDINGALIEKTKVSDDIYVPIRGQIRMN